MKTIRTLLAFVAVGMIAASPLLAADPAGKKATCCEQAAKNGKECTHKCCVAAHRDGKSCEKCNPDKQDLKNQKKAAEKK